jgi:radical SAM superfamily enzyme YgiQ (UPF0313 family)
MTAKKAILPPLGLLTIAAMLPQEWDKKLVDMNVATLTDRDIEWADYVFIGAMVVQSASAKEVVKRCKRAGVKIVAGGPLFTSASEEFEDVDHLVLNEAESTLPLFLEDLKKGCVKQIYTSKERPDLSRTPVPMWSLVNMKNYRMMSIQYSRGCPFDCEFCYIIVLNGNRPRTKTEGQLIAELEALYNLGWRETVFIVDDNFIGNRRKLKEEILPAMIQWQKDRNFPFAFLTEASINLADDEKLMKLMAKAGFETVFIGIETPNEESLVECNKIQNRNRDLVASIKKIQNSGMQVLGGFILGFDNDRDSIFNSQHNFIQKSGIVTAMVGLLNAPRGTRLYERLKKENRLLDEFSGDNTDCSMNFLPKMGQEKLINGYRHVLTTIYSSKQYYDRVKIFLKEYKPRRKKRVSQLHLWRIRALIRSMWVLGILDRDRWHYWRFFISTALKNPRSFPISMSFAIIGFHFRTIVRKYTMDDVKR